MTMANERSEHMHMALDILLSAASDVTLVFGDEGTVRAHSLYLKQWSGVLSSLLDGCGNSSSTAGSSSSSSTAAPATTEDSSSYTGALTIPMAGTIKQDWLTAMSFVYPVVPQPKVTWDNLQVLLTVGNKYDMPALLCKAGMFLQDNKQELSGSPHSPRFAWKWIVLADRAGLTDVAQACIISCFSGRRAAAVEGSCKKEVLLGMSPATCCHLLEALAQQVSAARKGCTACSDEYQTDLGALGGGRGRGRGRGGGAL